MLQQWLESKFGPVTRAPSRTNIQHAEDFFGWLETVIPDQEAMLNVFPDLGRHYIEDLLYVYKKHGLFAVYRKLDEGNRRRLWEAYLKMRPIMIQKFGE